MDWSAAATAAVGIAGILGALWTSNRARRSASDDLNKSLNAASESLLTTINADNERARLSEKRRIYASCLAAINAANLTFSAHRDARNARNAKDERKWTNEEARMEAWSDAKKARTDMLDAVMELELIAPEDVIQHAWQAREHLIQYWVETSKGAEPDYSLVPSGEGVLRHLRSAMRADLGEPAE